MLLILFFKLATLTVVRGDELRERSDDKRMRELSITAPRGEIRDRYGRLLAGNKPSFTVQVLKDELNSKNVNRNDIILNLVKILEEEGETYVDELPIILNVFEINEEYQDSYNNVDNAEDLVLDTIISQGLVGEYLETNYLHIEGNSNINFITGEKARIVLKKEGIDVPVEAFLDSEGEVSLRFDESRDIDKWKMENNLGAHLTAKNTLVSLIDENILRKVLSSPIARGLAYELLDSKGLAYGIELKPYSLKYDSEYKAIKEEMIAEIGKGITFETSAEDDFVTIALDTVGIELLDKIFKQNEGKENETIVVPAQLLVEKLKAQGITVPVKVTINEEQSKVEIQYIDEQTKEDFNNNENDLNQELEPKEALYYLGEKYNQLKGIITNADTKIDIQKLILGKGVNPQISVSTWQYVANKNKASWFSKYGIPSDSNIEEAFNILRDKYKIKEDLTQYEARYILVIIEQLNKQGYKAYEPINISYGIDEKTIARIEENNATMKGVEISVEPVRYYPNGNLAVHILGYMGKISQSYEIEKYLQKRDDYTLNDIIGKTGIEQTYEDVFNGKDGTKKVEVDVFGNTIRVIEETKAVPGGDVYLTIDSKLQKVAEDALKHALEEIQVGGEFKSQWGNYDYKEKFENANTGAVVAIDIKTGEILALANYPSYDPNLFATGISTADWESLKPEDEDNPLAPKPLYNIATKTIVAPGSIFKMITALAGLEKGLDPNETIDARGYIEYGNTKFGCWYWNDFGGMHRHENVYEAIKDSCNYYFYTLTLGENQKTGDKVSVTVTIEDILDLTRKFGLDKKTGIEISGESDGNVPDPQSKVDEGKDNIRSYLRMYLKYYIKEDVEMTDEELNEKIEEVAKWAELDYTLGRKEVIERFDKLGFDSLRDVDEEVLTIPINLADMMTYTILRSSRWMTGDTLNVSIGQGVNAYTPIQMANYIATLSNGGYKYQASVVDKIIDYNNDNQEQIIERIPERISLNDYENLEHVKKGMDMVTEPGGTAYSIFRGFPVDVAGKTGTAQAPGDADPFAWFVAFAPYDDPQIAVATLVFQGGHGGYTAPIAKEIIAQYLGLNSQETDKPSFKNELVR